VIKSGMNGKVTLMYDHATQHCGYYLPESGTVRFQISLSPRALMKLWSLFMISYLHGEGGEIE
jgi:hypothetical protein